MQNTVHEETGKMVVAYDENGPIEVEVIGAQPVGETIIESLRDAFVPQKVTPIGVNLTEAVREAATELGEEILATGHAERTHHRYGPSKLGYIHTCPGFTSTDGTSEAAEQGTRLHEIMDLLINRYKTSRRPLLELLSEYCTTNQIDDEERGLLVSCIRTVNEWLPKAKEIHNEIRVYINNPDGTELNHGLLDLLFIFGETALLIDLKFGWIPVPPAADNLQGRAYALGCFNKFHRLNKIAVMFVQPKLGATSTAVYTRPQINEMYQTIRQVIDRAELVQRDPAGTLDMLTPSDYCSYCLHSKNGTCPAKIKQLKSAVVALQPQASPFLLDLDKIDSPEKAAKLRYAIELLEGGDFLSSAKEKCREMALQNGGDISFETPEGTIRYAIEDRRHDRSLGDTLDVATTLKDQGVLTFEEVLCCADLSIGKLENAGATSIFEKNKAEQDRQLAAKEAELNVLTTAGKITKTEAKKQLAAVKAEFKVTKKESTEAFQKILENQGLLSRPEGTIPVLRRKKNEPSKQIAKP